MSLLTSDGLLVDRAGTSIDCNMKGPDGETGINVKNQQTETNHADKSDLDSTDGEETAHTDEDKAKQENNRKCKRVTPSKLEQELVHSQNTLKSLRKHLERKTCPKSLQYRARARIKADSNFRKDIKRLRSKAEQDYVQALIRNIEGLRTAIKQEKKSSGQQKTKKYCNQNNSFHVLGAQGNC